MSNYVTFADMVDAAVQRAWEEAAPYVPSRAQYDAELMKVCISLDCLVDPWEFIRASHRGAGSMDAVTSEMYKAQHREC